jgi:hypothetical protein
MSELSEVQSTKDIAVVGLQPSALQSFVIYGTVIPAYSGCLRQIPIRT